MSVLSEDHIEELITRLEELMTTDPKELSPSNLNTTLSEATRVLVSLPELERELSNYRLLAAGIGDLVHRLTNRVPSMYNKYLLIHFNPTATSSSFIIRGLLCHEIPPPY